jgi:hypothetical protein
MCGTILFLNQRCQIRITSFRLYLCESSHRHCQQAVFDVSRERPLRKSLCSDPTRRPQLLRGAACGGHIQRRPTDSFAGSPEGEPHPQLSCKFAQPLGRPR